MYGMNVRQEREGDRGGDRGDASVGVLGHARACSRHFWVLSSEASDDEASTADEVSDFSLHYVCRTPGEDHHRDLSSRKEKREEKRRLQRWAARSLKLSPPTLVSQNSDRKPALAEKHRRTIKLPVLEPSTFDLGHVLDATA
jgi:hypothetical protein